MGRAIEQIERELAALCEMVKAIAAEFGKAYTNYLQALGQATRVQLVLASYQICTQGYAKQFLSLSFSQRQQLQQAIRKLGKKAASEMLFLLAPDCSGVVEAGLSSKPSQQNISSNPPLQESEGEEDEENNSEQPNESGEQGKNLSIDSLIPLISRPKGSENSKPFSFPPSLPLPLSSNPIELAQWQGNLEEAIAHILKTVSLETNHVLQKAGILPQKLPPPLLEAATAASEAVSDLTAAPPNLMNLLIETENSQESEESSVTQLIAIQLRLSEIEFTDAHVRSARNQIRQLENRLNSLKREYKKKQRERMVAEAEAAWRSSWFEE